MATTIVALDRTDTNGTYDGDTGTATDLAVWNKATGAAITLTNGYTLSFTGFGMYVLDAPDVTVPAIYALEVTADPTIFCDGEFDVYTNSYLTEDDVKGIRHRLNLNNAVTTGEAPSTDLNLGDLPTVLPTYLYAGQANMDYYEATFGTTVKNYLLGIKNGQELTELLAYRAAILAASGDFMSPHGLSCGAASGDPLVETEAPNFTVTVTEVTPGQHMLPGQSMIIGIDRVTRGSEAAWQFEITHDGNDYVVDFPLIYRGEIVSWGGAYFFIEGSDNGSPIPAMTVTLTPNPGVLVDDMPLVMNIPTLPVGLAQSHIIDSRGNIIGYGAGRHSPMITAPTASELIAEGIATVPTAVYSASRTLTSGTEEDGTTHTDTHAEDGTSYTLAPETYVDDEDPETEQWGLAFHLSFTAPAEVRPNQVLIKGYFNSPVLGSHVDVLAWNWRTGSYELISTELTKMTSINTLSYYAYPLRPNHVNGSTRAVRIRFRSESGDTQDRLYLDHVALTTVAATAATVSDHRFELATESAAGAIEEAALAGGTGGGGSGDGSVLFTWTEYEFGYSGVVGHEVPDVSIVVYANAEATGDPLASVTTDEDGVAKMWLNPGVYYMFRRKSGRVFDNPLQVTVSASTGDSVEENAGKTAIEFTWGEYSDPDHVGEPEYGVAGVTVRAYDNVGGTGDPVQTATTGATGLATFWLESGTYYLYRSLTGRVFDNPATIEVS